MNRAYAEANPFSDSSGNYSGQVGYLVGALARTPAYSVATCRQLDAAATVDGSGVVCTDPPYYNQVSPETFQVSSTEPAEFERVRDAAGGGAERSLAHASRRCRHQPENFTSQPALKITTTQSETDWLLRSFGSNKDNMAKCVINAVGVTPL
jgi:hypothetical protein